MGFSTIATAAILGVAILVATNTFVGSVIPALTDLNDAYKELEDRMIERAHTDVEITGVSTTTGNPFNLSISVENNGSETLKTEKFTVLINGTIYDFTCSTSYLYPEKTAVFTIHGLTERGLKRIKVVCENGISDYAEYSV
ncbi:MAG: hypothetical protein DRN09_01500 [Thermoplasmata archaeon]|nr:MAG: hypothetical protein DRN09_01500 [Thermoplasmata archaeon]